MALIAFNRIDKAFGTQVCVADGTGQINPGDRIGLIGANGSGKTTLARCLLGVEPIDDGQLERSRELKIACLAQDPELDPTHTVFSAAFTAFADLVALEAKIESLTESLAEPLAPDAQEQALEALGAAQDRFERAGGYAATQRVEATLMALGFAKDDLAKPVTALSGGERARVGLATTLLLDPEVMLLDEPTNHLDIEGVIWLEQLLTSTERAFIVISHDRYFLDRVTNTTWELERGRLTVTRGNYTRSKVIKAERQLTAERAFANQQAQIAKEEAFIRRHRGSQRSAEAKGRWRRLQRLKRDALIDRPRGAGPGILVRLATDRRVGAQVCSASGLAVRFGARTLFAGLDLEVRPSETLAIMGKNGAGKTTLLTCLLGEREPTEGSVRRGATVTTGYLRQREVFPDDAQAAFDYVHAQAPSLPRQRIHDLLASLGLSAGDIEKPLAVLSGGERRRVALAVLLLGDANFLFLDEPTNHLDIPAREALEAAIAAYSGTIVLVSHDRYLVDQLADRVLWMDGGTTRLFSGTYTEMRKADEAARLADGHAAKQAEKDAAKNERARSAKPAKKKPGRAGKSNKRARQTGAQGAKTPQAARRYRRFKGSVQDLEREIEAQQKRLAALAIDMAQPEVLKDGARTRELTFEYHEVQERLEELEAEWLDRAG